MVIAVAGIECGKVFFFIFHQKKKKTVIAVEIPDTAFLHLIRFVLS